MGATFIERVDEAIGKIALNPLGFRPVVEEVRRVNLVKFPYGLFYRVESEGSVVVACLHEKRHLRLVKARALRRQTKPRKL